MKEKIIEILKDNNVYEGEQHEDRALDIVASRITELIEGRRCMYCEKELKPGEAIVICKECTQ
jgi:hypothetical protein